MRSQTVDELAVGDLVVCTFFKFPDEESLELGIIIDLFDNAGNQKFAEILWNDNSLNTIDLASIQKLNSEDDI